MASVTQKAAQIATRSCLLCAGTGSTFAATQRRRKFSGMAPLASTLSIRAKNAKVLKGVKVGVGMKSYKSPDWNREPITTAEFQRCRCLHRSDFAPTSLLNPHLFRPILSVRRRSMPRYFVLNGEFLSDDGPPDEFPDLEAVRAVVLESAREVLSQEVLKGTAASLHPDRGRRREGATVVGDAGWTCRRHGQPSLAPPPCRRPATVATSTSGFAGLVTCGSTSTNPLSLSSRCRPQWVCPAPSDDCEARNYRHAPAHGPRTGRGRAARRDNASGVGGVGTDARPA